MGHGRRLGAAFLAAAASVVAPAAARAEEPQFRVKAAEEVEGNSIEDLEHAPFAGTVSGLRVGRAFSTTHDPALRSRAHGYAYGCGLRLAHIVSGEAHGRPGFGLTAEISAGSAHGKSTGSHRGCPPMFVCTQGIGVSRPTRLEFESDELSMFGGAFARWSSQYLRTFAEFRVALGGSLVDVEFESANSELGTRFSGGDVEVLPILRAGLALGIELSRKRVQAVRAPGRLDLRIRIEYAWALSRARARFDGERGSATYDLSGASASLGLAVLL
ncbi:MAG: hypothetical protein L0216_10100 [Planctomycetales bacterium]|nr:hypothetical protein [Planctomycetales bacterium]